jgi:DNA gyrase subunit B
MHCLWEIIDNAVDEALGGFCSHVEVVLGNDGSAAVSDNGRGVPVDTHSRTGLSGVELVYTRLHAGGKFGGGSYAASGGLHGVGASVVNALSHRLDVEVDRDGKTHAMSFRRGEPGEFKNGSPDDAFTPFTDQSRLRKSGRWSKTVTGTRVRFWPDRQIFLADAGYDWDGLTSRARQTSYLVPGLKLVVRDERGPEPVEDVFHHTGGISEFVEYLSPGKPVTDVLRLSGSEKFQETVPVLDDDGQMVSKDAERECFVDVALRWDEGYDTVHRSFVNVVATPKGGTHVMGFEQGLVRTLRDQIKKNARRLKAGNDKIEKDDVMEGMTYVVTVRLEEPQFEGQTKEVLGTAAVRSIVTSVVERELSAALGSTKRAEKAQASAVLEKVVSAVKARVAARQHKEAIRRKNALETSALPTKLVDCRSTDLDRSELFIVEGDSALGTGRSARDSEFQALLPIRGKILNVQKASVGDMLKNAECAAIFQVLGAGSGKSFDIEQARYGRTILMTDADVDGAHIRTLLITLFFRYMRPYVEAGRLYAAMPPLHRVELIKPRKGQDKYIYTYTDAEIQRVLRDLDRRNVRYKEPPQRYKGLGEMDPDQLAETTMDPRHRRLRRITAEDGEAADRVFELLMGNDVAPRKEFIIAGAAELDPERIDT